MGTQVTNIYTAQPHLLTAHIISVEVDLSFGLHSFSIVGLAGKAVDEAKDRVSAAIKNSGWKSPKNKNQKVVISLAPANIRKDSTGFDLAVAIAYLVAAKELKFVGKKLFIGELSLYGKIQGIQGVLPIILEAKRNGIKECFVSLENAEEAALVDDICIYPAETLLEVVGHLQKTSLISKQTKTHIIPEYREPEIDMSDVAGNSVAKRAIEISLAGGHNIIMYGPAGTGKTMLARATISLLPDLSFDEILETTSIHSLYGGNQGVNQKKVLVTTPPFRSPHHTASHISIIGGGAMLKPGEVTLAHRGVLFLDEMSEFSSQVLETLREPLEEGSVRLSRARGSAIYPASFILIGAMNPCSCGNFGSIGKTCTCSALEIARHRRKLSGPITDRIDLWVEVSKVDHQNLDVLAEKSVDIAIRIKKAREIQTKRYAGISKRDINNTTHIRLNSELNSKDVRLYIKLDEECKNILDGAAKKLDLSARGYYRVIKTSRTIADLAGENIILPAHIYEAISYRTKIYN